MLAPKVSFVDSVEIRPNNNIGHIFRKVFKIVERTKRCWNSLFSVIVSRILTHRSYSNEPFGLNKILQLQWILGFYLLQWWNRLFSHMRSSRLDRLEFFVNEYLSGTDTNLKKNNAIEKDVRLWILQESVLRRLDAWLPPSLWANYFELTRFPKWIRYICQVPFRAEARDCGL